MNVVVCYYYFTSDSYDINETFFVWRNSIEFLYTVHTNVFNSNTLHQLLLTKEEKIYVDVFFPTQSI